MWIQRKYLDWESHVNGSLLWSQDGATIVLLGSTEQKVPQPVMCNYRSEQKCNSNEGFLEFICILYHSCEQNRHPQCIKDKCSLLQSSLNEARNEWIFSEGLISSWHYVLCAQVAVIIKHTALDYATTVDQHHSLSLISYRRGPQTDLWKRQNFLSRSCEGHSNKK